jgi:hypothetical protein
MYMRSSVPPRSLANRFCSSTKSSNRSTLALAFDWRAFGEARIQSSSALICRRRDDSVFSTSASLRAFASRYVEYDPSYGIPFPPSMLRIHSVRFSRKKRSCVTATTVPLYVSRNRSSHSTLSASKWFVGSSRINRSGRRNSSAHSATRLLSPPLSTACVASPGGHRNASSARSTFRSSSHPSFASMAS